MIDILQHSKWQFPTDTVYILGTGKNGLLHFDRIPKDAWVIGVNQAIDIWLYYNVPVSIWLCADGTLPEQEWFTNKVDYIIERGFPLTDSANPTTCFSTGVICNAYPATPYYFTHGYTLREEPKHKPCWGVLRAGGSIGAQALQLAYWKGATRVVLCGIDMAGSKYFNNEENINPRLRPDGVSKHHHMFQKLYEWMRVSGVEVVSLSDTALNIPTVT